MPLRRLLSTAFLASAACLAAPAHAVQPALETQLERLAGLLGDSHATAYPQAAQVQKLSGAYGQQLVLALFTIEAYGGGNNHRQYMAVFEEEIDESGPRGHLMLRGVTQVGAKGWRAVTKLQAEARVEGQSGRTRILVPAFANTAGDAANFPSRKTTIHLLLDRNLGEVQAEVAP